MKANEAPRKIYLTPLECWVAGFRPQEDNTIEYTRTDAFIEKAGMYLEGKLLRYIDLCERGVGISTEEFIEKFKNYMKRE